MDVRNLSSTLEIHVYRAVLKRDELAKVPPSPHTHTHTFLIKTNFSDVIKLLICSENLMNIHSC
jgi:hypothetical protein